MVQIADHIQLFFLVDSDIQLQDCVYVDDPQFSVVIRLDFQIRAGQLQLQAADHALLAAIHVHPAVKGQNLFQPACFSLLLFSLVQYKDDQFAFYHYFAFGQTELCSLHDGVLPDDLADVRLIGRENYLVLDPAGIPLPDCQGGRGHGTGLHLYPFRSFHSHRHFLISQFFHRQLQRGHCLNPKLPGIDQHCRDIFQHPVQLQTVPVACRLHIHGFLKGNLSFYAM